MTAHAARKDASLALYPRRPIRRSKGSRRPSSAAAVLVGSCNVKCCTPCAEVKPADMR